MCSVRDYSTRRRRALRRVLAGPLVVGVLCAAAPGWSAPQERRETKREVTAVKQTAAARPVRRPTPPPPAPGARDAGTSAVTSHGKPILNPCRAGGPNPPACRR